MNMHNCKPSVIICIAFLFGACSVTYDLPVMYKKNYVPGTNILLRFDGYYTSGIEGTEKPLFLYRDGSVWFGETYVTQSVAEIELAKKEPNLAHSWGNYKVDGDTILIERFNRQETTNNYRRIILKGIIQMDAIHWVSREENRLNPVVVNYDTKFHATTSKPDSTGNWTRTRAQYNK
jgi:hypothetical protein